MKQKHHLLYRQAQKQALGVVWDNTTTPIPVSYHRKITSLQREGVPSITTLAKIERDKLLRKIP